VTFPVTFESHFCGYFVCGANARSVSNSWVSYAERLCTIFGTYEPSSGVVMTWLDLIVDMLILTLCCRAVVPLVSALEHNAWFTKLNFSNFRMVSDFTLCYSLSCVLFLLLFGVILELLTSGSSVLFWPPGFKTTHQDPHKSLFASWSVLSCRAGRHQPGLWSIQYWNRVKSVSARAIPQWVGVMSTQ